LATHSWLTAGIARLLAGYVRLCGLTIRWQGDGRAELAAALSEGPVVYVVWHQRLLYSAAHWPREAGLLGTIHDPSPAGSVAGHYLSRFRARPLPMTKTASGLALLRQAVGALKDGTSIGLAADGPTGPARVAKSAPIDWARIANRPVWIYAFSVRRGWRLKTWDNLLLPLPFTRGAFAFRPFDVKIDRHADDATLNAARQSLTDRLNALTAELDLQTGLGPDDVKKES
jgi:lysophospholipid acyltransferase (LPLAT)-like uncharacterized protein